MKPEQLAELSVNGVVVFLFGISWVAFASIQEAPVYPVCSNGSIPNIPPCWLPSRASILFYTLGAFAIIIGTVLLILRLHLEIEIAERITKGPNPPTTVTSALEPTKS